MFEHFLVTVVAQSRVTLGEIVVTIVDNGIIVARRIVNIIIADIKEGHLTKIGWGVLGNIRQIATHLTQQNSPVGNDLQLIHDASHRPQRISSIVQMILVCIDYLIRLLVEKIATRGKTAENADGADQYI